MLYRRGACGAVRSELDHPLLAYGLERPHLIVAQHLVLCTFLRATPCGRTDKASPIFERASGGYLSVCFDYHVSRFLRPVRVDRGKRDG